jgi:hypothetical protein
MRKHLPSTRLAGWVAELGSLDLFLALLRPNQLIQKTAGEFYRQIRAEASGGHTRRPQGAAEAFSHCNRACLRQLQLLRDRVGPNERPSDCIVSIAAAAKWSRLVLHPRRQSSRSRKGAPWLWQTDTIYSPSYSRSSSAARGSNTPHDRRRPSKDATA